MPQLKFLRSDGTFLLKKIYGLTITGLRFFTVYGEWGRPDMAFLNLFLT